MIRIISLKTGQTGKTWLIRDEIKKSGYTKFEVNFIDQPDLVDYLNTQMSAEDFLVKLKLIMPEECKPHETVVFLMKSRSAQK